MPTFGSRKYLTMKWHALGNRSGLPEPLNPMALSLQTDHQMLSKLPSIASAEQREDEYGK